VVLQRNRDLVPDGAVRALLVVVSTPNLQFFPGVVKAEEPMGVQALGPQTPVEGLDEGVVSRFARPGEIQDDIVGIGPQIQIPRDEFRALIDPNRLRITSLLANLDLT